MRVAIIDRGGADRFRRMNGEPWLHQHQANGVLLTNPNRVDEASRDGFEAVLGFPIDDSHLTQHLLHAYHDSRPINGVAVFPENLQLPVAQFRDAGGAGGPSAAWVRRFRDKHLMKQIAESAGIACASHALATSRTEINTALLRHGRVVVKPRDGAGSADIRYVNSSSDVEALPHRLLGGIVEEFVSNDLIHIDCLIRRRAVQHRSVFQYVTPTTEHAKGLPTGTVIVQDPILLREADALLDRVIDAFDVSDAVLHLEAFVTNQGLVFNEVACRVGGGTINEMVLALSGYNLFGSLIDIALDVPSRTDQQWTGPPSPALGDVLFYPTRGIFEGMSDDSVPSQWIHERQVFAAPGDEVGPVGRVGGCVAQYVIKGDDEAEVRTRIQQMMTAVAVKVVHK